MRNAAAIVEVCVKKFVNLFQSPKARCSGRVIGTRRWARRSPAPHEAGETSSIVSREINMKNSKLVVSTLALAACAGSALAQRGSVLMNEFFINPPSSAGADNTREFVELKGQPNAPLTGIWLVQIDGDNSVGNDSTATGVIDQAIDLSSYTLGSNGLLLIRDAAIDIDCSFEDGVQGPDAGTSVVVFNFTPDLENGSATYLLVRNFTGTVNQDLDTGLGGDGILDAQPWGEIIDVVGFQDGDDVDAGIPSYQYATQLGGIDVSDRLAGVPTGFTSDVFVRICNTIATFDTDGLSYGPFFFDPNEVIVFNATTGAIEGQTLPADFLLSPGRTNPGDGNCTTGPVCNDIDVNNDNSSFDPTDIDAFLSVFSEGPCVPAEASCDSIDFNNDGSLFDPCDIDAFLLVFSEGPCTLCGV
jgi:hypothetical protein